jgi:hypothetical protein
MSDLLDVPIQGLSHVGSILNDFADQVKGAHIGAEVARQIAKAAQETYQAVAVERRLESLRQRALYVGIDNRALEVTAPDSVGEADYRRVAGLFETTAKVLKVFDGVEIPDEVLELIRAIMIQQRDQLRA